LFFFLFFFFNLFSLIFSRELKPAIPFVLSSLDNLHHFEIAIDVLVEFVSNPKNAKHGTTVCSLIPFLVSRHQELVKAINGMNFIFIFILYFDLF